MRRESRSIDSTGISAETISGPVQSTSISGLNNRPTSSRYPAPPSCTRSMRSQYGVGQNKNRAPANCSRTQAKIALVTSHCAAARDSICAAIVIVHFPGQVVEQ